MRGTSAARRNRNCFRRGKGRGCARQALRAGKRVKIHRICAGLCAVPAPRAATEIVSGGAKGADALGKRYAQENGLKYTEFAPDYARYQRRAPLMRNVEIAEYSDYVIALWDGKSRGTAHAINACIKSYTEVRVVMCR